MNSEFFSFHKNKHPKGPSRMQQLMKMSMSSPFKLQLMEIKATPSPKVQFLSTGSMT